MVHLYAYTGIRGSLNALFVLIGVTDKQTVKDIADAMGNEVGDVPSDSSMKGDVL
jgi:hypothetical protein